MLIYFLKITNQFTKLITQLLSQPTEIIFPLRLLPGMRSESVDILDHSHSSLRQL